MTAAAGSLLAAITAAARRSAAVRSEAEPEARLERRAAAAAPRAAQFVEALCRRERVNVIAECKRRSPVGGLLSAEYDPAALAAAYERAGAAAVSVLTEPAFFDGALSHLQAVRRAVGLPLLRKDFIVSRYQLLEARASGADAALLIVAALDDRTLGALVQDAASLGLAALVEVHDERELQRALAAGARLVGVNNRDLRTMTVSLDVSRRLAGLFPDGVVAVAESGLRTAAEIRELRGAGYDAFLIGERLLRRPAPGQALDELVAAATALCAPGAGPPGGGA